MLKPQTQLLNIILLKKLKHTIMCSNYERLMSRAPHLQQGKQRRCWLTLQFYTSRNVNKYFPEFPENFTVVSSRFVPVPITRSLHRKLLYY